LALVSIVFWLSSSSATTAANARALHAPAPAAIVDVQPALDTSPPPAPPLETPRSAARTRSPARAPSLAPRQHKTKRCDPPFDLDPAGRKIFRVDCL
jgi:hypothetical protein